MCNMANMLSTESFIQVNNKTNFHKFILQLYICDSNMGYHQYCMRKPNSLAPFIMNSSINILDFGICSHAHYFSIRTPNGRAVAREKYHGTHILMVLLIFTQCNVPTNERMNECPKRTHTHRIPHT